MDTNPHEYFLTTEHSEYTEEFKAKHAFMSVEYCFEPDYARFYTRVHRGNRDRV